MVTYDFYSRKLRRNETMMNYQRFIEKVERNIMTYLPNPDGMSAEVREVHKNNGITLQGLTIKDENSNIAPTIYLEQFYDEYNQGHEFSEVMSDIAAAYENSKKSIIPGFSLEELDNNKLFGELVCTERNEELLRDIPFKTVFDGRYAVIFRYQVKVNDIDGSVLITDDIAEAKGLSVDDLYKYATTNSGEQNTPKLQTMGSVLAAMLGDSSIDADVPNLYVLCNETQHYGSFMIMRPETQKILMDSFDSDLIVIPSSIHELLLMKYNSNIDLKAVNKMIQEVNQTVVASEDILGDEYFILKKTDDGFVFDDCYASDANSTIGSSLG